MPKTVHTPPARSARMRSLDALRGFNMFWIVGAEHIVESLRRIETGGAVGFVAYELQHSPWEGFRFEDLILPLFIFLMGAAIPFSLGKLREAEGVQGATRRVWRRATLLYLLGVLYYGGFGDPLHSMRFLGVLQRIAICYLFASMLFLHVRLRTMLATCAGILVAYWAFLTFVPAPSMAHASFALHENWANYIDQRYLPGRLWYGSWDPEGLLTTVPSFATALLGVFAGLLLKCESVRCERKATYLAVAGVTGVALGFAWGLQFPVIKNLWTSSYVLVAAGYSALLMAAFYWLIDLQQWRQWAAPFLWIGANALTIYLGVKLINLHSLLNWLVLHLTPRGGWDMYEGVLVTTAALSIEIAVLAVLYRRRIFFRV